MRAVIYVVPLRFGTPRTQKKPAQPQGPRSSMSPLSFSKYLPCITQTCRPWISMIQTSRVSYYRFKLQGQSIVTQRPCKGRTVHTFQFISTHRWHSKLRKSTHKERFGMQGIGSLLAQWSWRGGPAPSQHTQKKYSLELQKTDRPLGSKTSSTSSQNHEHELSTQSRTRRTASAAVGQVVNHPSGSPYIDEQTINPRF